MNDIAAPLKSDTSIALIYEIKYPFLLAKYWIVNGPIIKALNAPLIGIVSNHKKPYIAAPDGSVSAAFSDSSQSQYIIAAFDKTVRESQVAKEGIDTLNTNPFYHKLNHLLFC